jgi:hypothetical protein
VYARHAAMSGVYVQQCSAALVNNAPAYPHQQVACAMYNSCNASRYACTAMSCLPLRCTCACRCLLSKAYNAAAPLLELELTEVDPARTAVGATDLLLYCYYGGMVATGGQSC